MRRFTILLLSILFLPTFISSLSAQDRVRKMDIENYEKRKIEYIRTEAALTNSEAEKYFPLNSEIGRASCRERV